MYNNIIVTHKAESLSFTPIFSSFIAMVCWIEFIVLLLG